MRKADFTETIIADLQCCGNCANFDDYGCKLCEEGGRAPNELCDEWIWDKLYNKDRR
jgi:recombinational DNA repair protein RecR